MASNRAKCEMKQWEGVTIGTLEAQGSGASQKNNRAKEETTQ